jgi:hypothetical protein
MGLDAAPPTGAGWSRLRATLALASVGATVLVGPYNRRTGRRYPAVGGDGRAFAAGAVPVVRWTVA